MLLKGFKRNLKSIEYDPHGEAVVVAYDFGAHVVVSPQGVELFEYKSGVLQSEPSLVNPSVDELLVRLKSMRNWRKKNET